MPPYSYDQSDETQQLQELIEELTQVSKNYDPTPGPAGYISRTNIIGKAKEIAHLMMNPTDMSMHHTVNMTEIVAIRTMLKLNVLQSIPSPGSISLADLANATEADPALVERMLRLLVGTSFLDQTDNYEYRHTKFSKAYITVPGPGNYFQFTHDEYLQTMADFHNYLSTHPPTEPSDPIRNPYTHRHDRDGWPVWQVMAQFPERLSAFQLGLMSQEDSVPIIGFYDYGSLYSPSTDGPDRITLVDVGGGQGQSIAQILSAYPSLDPSRFVLQDLPEPIAQGSRALPPEVKKMVHDFWTPQPVKHAKAYFLRRIIHDYSDENCVKILSQLREAMAQDSKVLIADMVMPKRVGEADLPAAAMDNQVMLMGGKERTEEGLRKILEEAGLVFVRVWRAREGGASGAIVEGRLKEE